MADTSLADYFNIAPSDTTWGIGQNALAQALPLLMRTRGTTNQQFGTALGMSLVSALLGYQARRSAAEQSLQAAEIGSQLIGMQTPQERLALIKGVDSTNVQQNLLGLNARIGEQELQNQLIQRRKVGELETAANFQFGEIGKKLIEQQLAVKRAEEAGIPLSQVDVLDTTRSKLGASLFGTTPEIGATDAASILADPTMQQALSKPQKEALVAQAELTKNRQNQIDDLRKQFTALPEVKNFSLIDTAAKVVARAVKDPSAVATQELVRRAVQLIEPGMAVREGEQAAIASSQSIPDQYKGALQTALTGEGGLQEDVRQGIMRIAQRAYEENSSRYKQTKQFFENIAEERKLPKKEVSYLGEAADWSSIIEGKTSANKSDQLQAILKELRTTTNPARIAELKAQASMVYQGQ